MATTINPSDQTITQYNVQTGGASNLLNNVAPSATSGVPVISQGASSQPIFGTALVAGGGTGQVTLTNHGVLVGAATAAITQLAAGSAGQVLQSGGASADPAYSTATYPATAGTSGNVLTSDGTNWNSSAATGGGVSVVSGSITSAQVKTLHGSPFQIIAAPGAGKAIQIISSVATMNYGGNNAFVNGGGQPITLVYGTTNSVFNLLVTSAIIATANQIVLECGTATIGGASTIASNVAVNAYNSSTTEISGNAAGDNTISYNILYRTVTIP